MAAVSPASTHHHSSSSMLGTTHRDTIRSPSVSVANVTVTGDQISFFNLCVVVSLQHFNPDSDSSQAWVKICLLYIVQNRTLNMLYDYRQCYKNVYINLLYISNPSIEVWLCVSVSLRSLVEKHICKNQSIYHIDFLPCASVTVTYTVNITYIWKQI